jgi:hypothetical protein
MTQNPKLTRRGGKLLLGKTPIATADLSKNVVIIGPFGPLGKFFGYDESAHVMYLLVDSKHIDDIRERAKTGDFAIFANRKAIGGPGTIQMFLRHPGAKYVAAAVQYFISGDDIVVTNMVVRPMFRRRGLNTRMMDDLRAHHSGLNLKFDDLTNEGRAFMESYGGEEYDPPRTKNPGSLARLEALADEGSGDFEEHYPQSARGEYDAEAEDIYYGRDVLWIGTEGRMVKVDPDYAMAIWGNTFDADKLAAVVQGIRDADDRVVFVAPYGTVVKIDPTVVKESIEYADEEEMDRPYTTGDEELDRYLVDPDEFKGRKREMQAKLKVAVKRSSGDLGKFQFTIRDGNHRAFGAMLAGEPYIYMIVADNQMQDFKQGLAPELSEILE